VPSPPDSEELLDVGEGSNLRRAPDVCPRDLASAKIAEGGGVEPFGVPEALRLNIVTGARLYILCLFKAMLQHLTSKVRWR
jgi:hypothetical protein